MAASEILAGAASAAEMTASALAPLSGPGATIARVVSLGLNIASALAGQGLDPVAELEDLLRRTRVDVDGAWKTALDEKFPLPRG